MHSKIQYYRIQNTDVSKISAKNMIKEDENMRRLEEIMQKHCES